MTDSESTDNPESDEYRSESQDLDGRGELQSRESRPSRARGLNDE